MKIRNWEVVIQKELHDRFEVKRGVFEKCINLDNSRTQIMNCIEKKFFETKERAILAVTSMSEKYPNFRFRTYKCPVCHRWHVTKRR